MRLEPSKSANIKVRRPDAYAVPTSGADDRTTGELSPEHSHAPLEPVSSQQTERHSADVSRAIRLRERVGNSGVQVVLG